MKTNVELVTHMMEFSAAGALKHAFIIEAIRKYAEAVIVEPPWDAATLAWLSQDAWKVCAAECLKEIGERK